MPCLTLKLDFVSCILSMIADHPYKILIIGGSGSGKTNALIILEIHQPDIKDIYSYDKQSYKTKYQLSISKQKSAGLKHFNDPKAFIELSNDIDDISKNIKEYNMN